MPIVVFHLENKEDVAKAAQGIAECGYADGYEKACLEL